jgi:hypothetical protein
MVEQSMTQDMAVMHYGNCPKDAGLAEEKMIVDACRSLGADALVLEQADHAMVVAMNIYDDTYATTSCDPDANLSAVARSLQGRLYSDLCDEGPVAFLPVARVHSAMNVWERQIALVFGRGFAAKLVKGATEGIAPGEMSCDALEDIRLHLYSVTGGCLDLQKVDK